MSGPEETTDGALPAAGTLPVESGIGQVMQVVKAAQYPIVKEEVLEEAWVFDAARDIDGLTVTIYPPDLVVVKRIIDQGKHLICRYAGGPLCVMSRRNVKPSEVKFL